MKVRHLIMMLLLASEDNKISTKTKIQKEMYFLSLLLQEEMSFRAHYYGPFSSEVEEGLDELVGVGFVNERRETLGVDNNLGFEIIRYEFSLTNEGKKFAETLKSNNPRIYEKIKDFTEKLKNIGDPNYMDLSIAAKAYFILHKNQAPMTPEQIDQEAKKFGWEIKKDNIHKAIEILKELGFVKDK